MIWNGATITPTSCIQYEGHFVSLHGEMCKVDPTPFGIIPPAPGWAAMPSPQSARLAINLLKYINSVRPKKSRQLPANEVAAGVVQSPEDGKWYKILVRLTEDDQWEMEGKPIPAALWGTEQDAGGALDTWRFAE